MKIYRIYKSRAVGSVGKGAASTHVGVSYPLAGIVRYLLPYVLSRCISGLGR